MPYTAPWDETQPLGSAAANTLDTIIQQLKRDIRERLNELVVDFTVDPVVPKAVGASVYSSVAKAHAATAIVWDSERFDHTALPYHVSGSAPIVIPAGRAGLYLIHAGVVYDTTDASDTYSLVVQKNATDLRRSDVKAEASVATFAQNIRVLAIEQLVAGDSLTVIFNRVAGGGVGTIRAGVANNGFEVVRIGGTF